MHTWLHKADSTYSRARPKNRGVFFWRYVGESKKKPTFLFECKMEEKATKKVLHPCSEDPEEGIECFGKEGKELWTVFVFARTCGDVWWKRLYVVMSCVADSAKFYVCRQFANSQVYMQNVNAVQQQWEVKSSFLPIPRWFLNSIAFSGLIHTGRSRQREQMGPVDVNWRCSHYK